MDRLPFVSRAVAFAALAGGLASAASRAWLCDDAFISFRYAWNLANGNGLVYNAGERVEGYTNFLWTLWCSVPLALGADVEPFAIGSGLVLFAVLLGLLYREHRTAVVPGLLPVALLGAAVTPDLAVYATCGLETCLVAVLALAGYAALADRRRALAGFVLGAAVLARPDAALFLVSGGLVVLAEDRAEEGFGKLRGALGLGAAAAGLVLPHLAFRLVYYGDLVPNTFYAKSANLSWWSQGLTYVGLVFGRYWPLLVGPVLAAVLLARSRRPTVDDPAVRPDRRRLVLALALSLPFIVYVAKVGGDFMFARLLVPVFPLLLVAVERSLALATERASASVPAAAAVLLILGLGFSPATVGTELSGHGIVDEWAFYHDVRPGWAEGSRRDGAILARFFAGLPVRVAFFGAEARLVYYARPAVAIESAAGLTDPFVAKQTLRLRGRVGHEKAAPAAYLLDVCRVHLTFDPLAGQITGLDAAIPQVPIDLGGVRGRVVTWDPALMSELGRRGARFPDLPRVVDDYIATAPFRSREDLETAAAGFERLYFSPAGDDVRRQRLLAVLKGR